MSLAVVKIGGTLLTRGTLASDLQAWLEARPEGLAHLFIVGGGGEVDRLRGKSLEGELSDDQAHWAAIDVMDDNSRRLAAVLKLPLLTHLSPRPTGDSFLAAGNFLRQEEPCLPGVGLPVGWQATSDSISARIASILDTPLVLLKAVRPPVDSRNLEALADCGYVDAFFPQASVGLRKIEFQTL